MRIGIDLGGTKLEGVVLDAHGGVLTRIRRPTPAAWGYRAIVTAIGELTRDLESQVGAGCSVGVGTPGAVSSRTGRMKNCNTTCLNNQPLLEDLARELDREVRIANDANCFTLSEATDGAAAGLGVVFGVILGTGVGGGIAVNGVIHEGPNRIAGEWGHTPLEPSGPECYCGRRGCVETLLSGPGLAADLARNGGPRVDAEQLMDLARAGDQLAGAALDRWIDRFGRAMATVLDILDPDAVVIGGGLSAIDELYTRGPAAVAKYLFSGDLRTPILRNLHGDSSGVRGAAMLWPA